VYLVRILGPLYYRHLQPEQLPPYPSHEYLYFLALVFLKLKWVKVFSTLALVL
jgi:hypothetical protein